MAPGVPSLRWPLSIPGRHPPGAHCVLSRPCNPELLGFELPPQPKLRLCNNGHTGEAGLGAEPQGRGGVYLEMRGRSLEVRLRVGRGLGSPASHHTVQLSLPSGLKMALGPGQEYRAPQLHLH